MDEGRKHGAIVFHGSGRIGYKKWASQLKMKLGIIFSKAGNQFGGFLKWWYPTTIGFPTKNDHFGDVLGVALFLETPIWVS